MFRALINKCCCVIGFHHEKHSKLIKLKEYHYSGDPYNIKYGEYTSVFCKNCKKHLYNINYYRSEENPQMNNFNRIDNKSISDINIEDFKVVPLTVGEHVVPLTVGLQTNSNTDILDSLSASDRLKVFSNYCDKCGEKISICKCGSRL